MRAYSLISCSGDIFSIGIYTSLRKLYIAFKKYVKDDLEWYSKEEIQTFYEIKKVNLNSEPLECSEFSCHGPKIEINWKKVFDK